MFCKTAVFFNQSEANCHISREINAPHSKSFIFLDGTTVIRYAFSRTAKSELPSVESTQQMLSKKCSLARSQL